VMKPMRYPKDAKPIAIQDVRAQKVTKVDLIGIDIFLTYQGDTEALATKLKTLCETMPLQAITNRGVKVWPHGDPKTYCVDHYRCRFTGDKDGKKVVTANDVIALQQKLSNAGYHIAKTENLFNYDDERGYTVGQGQ
jgi:isocitrate dehydrogenase